MARNVKSKTGKKHAETQTQEIDTALEIARLQEQVKLLKIENEVLRKYTVEKPNIVKDGIQQRSSPRVIRKSVNNESIIEPVQPRNVRAPSVPKSATKLMVKGCSCKGNCSTKICGCVKKENKCGDSCRCSNANCQNQEQSNTDTNKENVDNVNTDIPIVELQKEKRVANKHLQNLNVKKGLFSPDVVGQEKDLNEEEFKTASLHFGSPKKLTYDSDEEKKNEDEKVKRKPRKGKGNEKETHSGRSRAQKTTLDVLHSTHVRKHRSTSNEEKRAKSDLEIEKHELRRCLSSEIDTQSDEDVEQAIRGKKGNNYLKNIMQGMVSLRRGKQKTAEAVIVENTATTTEIIVTNAQNKSETHKKNRNAKLIKEVMSPENKSDSSLSECERSTPSSGGSKSSGSPDQAHDETNHDGSGKENDSEAEFNPMKPRRQLLRTPTHGIAETSTCNISDIPLPLPVSAVKQEEEEEQPLPADFHEAEVDLAEYQAQLVACGKCKRKFYPFRIKKHEACCKKV